MIKGKIYIYNFFYIKLEFYLNLIIIQNDKLRINNFNLNLFFLKKNLLNKFLLKSKVKKDKLFCLYYFNYNVLSQFAKSNNLIVFKNIYFKKYINNNIILNRFYCFYSIFNFFKILFFILIEFLNFIKKNEQHRKIF